jgi:hypothetical protein
MQMLAEQAAERVATELEAQAAVMQRQPPKQAHIGPKVCNSSGGPIPWVFGKLPGNFVDLVLLPVVCKPGWVQGL